MKILFSTSAILIACLGLGSMPSSALTLDPATTAPPGTTGSTGTFKLTIADQVSPGCLAFYINGMGVVSGLTNGQSAVIRQNLTQGSSYNFGYIVTKCGTTTLLWKHLRCATLIPANSAGTIYVTAKTQTTCPTIQ